MGNPVGIFLNRARSIGPIMGNIWEYSFFFRVGGSLGKSKPLSVWINILFLILCDFMCNSLRERLELTSNDRDAGIGCASYGLEAVHHPQKRCGHRRN